VRVYDIEKMETFKTNVRNVAASRDFNRLEIEGIDPNALENSYASLENSAAQAINRVIESQRFEGEERFIILNLMALLVIRNPRMRETWSDFMGRLMRTTSEMIVSTREIWESTKGRMEEAGYKPDHDVSYEDMREFINGGEYDIVTDRLVHIRLELETLEKVIHLLSARKWRLGILPDNAPDIVTCDHPVSLISTIERPDTFMGRALGYGLPDTAVVFPITRRFSLWGTFDGQDEIKAVGRLQSALFNTHTLGNAERQIYAYDDSFEFVWGREIRPGTALLATLKKAKADRN